MKKYAALLYLFLLFSITTIEAREISFNKYADRLFTDSTYNAIIKNQCQKTARENGAAQIHFESNYMASKDSIIALSRALIEKKFTETEKKISAQKIKDKIACQLFEKSLSNAVSVTLSQNQALKKALLKKDLNDRIISFDSKIHIDPYGSIEVTEMITVLNFSDESGNSNNTIKRGITRDFPTRYSTERGFISTVPFTLISITRNGEKENYRIENLSNGYRVFCGRSDYFLKDGIHKYIIRYTTGNQLKFHADRDEFYWNVTGNGWGFSIDRASCEIMFPDKAILSDMNCYTGYQGDNGQDCNIGDATNNNIKFYTNKRLGPNQGFTVSVSARKGIFIPENSTDQIKKFVLDNKFIMALLLFILLLFIILYRYWSRVGRDIKQGIIIPEFQPPAGLSPADVGYIYHQEYSDKLFTSALIDLAVQKKVHIQVDRKGMIFKSNVYKFLSPENNPQKEITMDYDLYNKYGFDPEDLYGIEIEKGTYNATFKSISSRFKNQIDSNILAEKTGKRTGGFLSLNQDYIGLGLFLLVMVSIGSIIYLSIVKPPLLTMVYTAVLLIIGFIIQIVFMKIIKAYSAEGRIMADKILGFKMYMETTEKNILDNLNPPEENIQLFEKYLPYAIALGIENKWSEKFKTIIEQSIVSGYTPSYYSMGSHHSFSDSSQSFASSFSSGLSNTVSSASTPPSSSSSGSGGGGFSGGGGGGGGGGGW